MRKNLKKIVKHNGKIYRHEISNELHNRKVVSIDKPQHIYAVLYHHQDMVALREKISLQLQAARASKEKVLIGTTAAGYDAVVALSELQNIM